MGWRETSIAILSVFALQVGGSALADTLTLHPTDDTRLRAGSYDGQNFDGIGLCAGQGCPKYCDSHFESLIKFDLRDLDAADVCSALR